MTDLFPIQQPSTKAVPEAHRRYWSNNTTCNIPREVIEALKPHAKARGIHPHELIRNLLIEIVDDKLVDAVLDDR